ncbi:hypothetical protein K227x_53230 [Rubripirellula lacrimiformis]|uniref:Uncharacterized protein n=1 Tax=Rubripirellula lacrimiformis TaxID=1930273 RepID=A0A517NIE0_9BACT|nr:hypothetical protein [Rubripirellula lacrimiformis]QDT06900.1 hypothetical protein K227x_53230 [Rubripirellula lacrimiformis]
MDDPSLNAAFCYESQGECFRIQRDLFLEKIDQAGDREGFTETDLRYFALLDECADLLGRLHPAFMTLSALTQLASDEADDANGV